MTPFDQTAKSITRLRKEAQSGKLTREAADRKIRALEAKQPRWVAIWTKANGKPATKVCKSEKAASAYEAKMTAKVKAGDASDPVNLRAPVRDILAYYLEGKLKGKGSYGSAKAHIAKATELIGHLRLDRISARADEILNEYIFETAAEIYPERKTLWNHKVYLAAAFAFWIHKKRLQMVTPWNVVDFPNPGSRRITTPSFEAYTKILAEASKPNRPAWVRVVFVIVWEHGRRGGEIHTMDWQNVHLKPGAEDLPWVRFQTFKQSRVTFDDVALYADAASALGSLWRVGASGRVFPVARSTFDNYLRDVMHTAGYPDLWLHDFRRSWNNRHRDLSLSLRSAMSGHRTEEMDERYWTERRKGTESVVRDSYLSRDPQEIDLESAEISSTDSGPWRRGRDSNPPDSGTDARTGSGVIGKSREKRNIGDGSTGGKGKQNPRVSHTSQEIGQEIDGSTPSRARG